MLEKIKKDNGAVSTLVLFTVLIFTVILMGAYLLITTMQKSQLKSDLRIQQIYQEDINDIDNIYNSIVDNYTNIT